MIVVTQYKVLSQCHDLNIRVKTIANERSDSGALAKTCFVYGGKIGICEWAKIKDRDKLHKIFTCTTCSRRWSLS